MAVSKLKASALAQQLIENVALARPGSSTDCNYPNWSFDGP
jgi:hypothetical protein